MLKVIEELKGYVRRRYKSCIEELPPRLKSKLHMPDYSMLSELFENLIDLIFIFTSVLFIEDQLKFYLKYLSTIHMHTGAGAIIAFCPHPSSFSIELQDPYTRLCIPLEHAPDGTDDAVLIRQTVEEAPENSLIVIEEPENHKNPVLLIQLAKEIAEKAVKKKHTLIMTTHSDLLIHAILKAIEEGHIKPEHVAVYYLERSMEHPWTRARRLRVYEDGTIESLPDAEQATVSLF